MGEKVRFDGEEVDIDELRRNRPLAEDASLRLQAKQREKDGDLTVADCLGAAEDPKWISISIH